MAYIVVIDDDEDFANSVATVMRAATHDVRIVLDAKNALSAMEERCPDLAILDVMFPEDTSAGFDLARSIRRNDSLKKVPVLMLTAVNEKYPFGFSARDIDEQWLPVTDFLEKPVDLDVLRNKVTKILAEHSSRAE